MGGEAWPRERGYGMVFCGRNTKTRSRRNGAARPYACRAARPPPPPPHQQRPVCVCVGCVCVCTSVQGGRGRVRGVHQVHSKRQRARGVRRKGRGAEERHPSGNVSLLFPPNHCGVHIKASACKGVERHRCAACTRCTGNNKKLNLRSWEHKQKQLKAEGRERRASLIQGFRAFFSSCFPRLCFF